MYKIFQLRNSICFLILFSFFNLFSQRLEVGFQSGLVYSSLNAVSIEQPNYDIKSEGWRNGYQVDLCISYLNKKNLGISISPGYLQKGFKSDRILRTGRREVTDLQFHYIHVPILLEFYLNEWINIGVGPELNFLLFAKENIDNIGDTKIKNYPDQKFSTSGQIEIDFKICKNLSTGLSFTRGISYIHKNTFYDNNDSNPLTRKRYNRTIGIMFKYTFNPIQLEKLLEFKHNIRSRMF